MMMVKTGSAGLVLALVSTMTGKAPAYTRALQFERSARSTRDPDQPFKPERAAKR